MRIQSNRHLFIVVSAVLTIFIASCWSLCYLIPRNTLKNNDRWIATKTTVEIPLAGSRHFVESTQSLAGNRLNLGAWHGFQEIIYKDKISPREVTFDFMLDTQAYLVFVFNKDEKGFSGVRFGNSNRFKNIYFTASNIGEFLSKQRIDAPQLERKRWYRVRMIFEEKAISLFLNHQLLGRWESAVLLEQQLGFRGSSNNVYVDNIVVKDRKGEVIFFEDFSNHRNSYLVFILSLLGASFFNVLLFFIFNVKGHSNDGRHVLTVNIIILLISVTLVSRVNYKFARYIKMDMRLNSDEKKRMNTFGKSILTGIENRFKRYSPGESRLFFIGSSQTWGAGAGHTGEAFVNVVETILNQRDSQAQYRCINGGSPGLTSKELFNIYHDALVKLNPKAVIINLSCNDSDPAEFKEYLTKFAEQLKGFPIVFVLEAKSIESKKSLNEKHKVMRTVASEFGIPVIDLNGYLTEKYDTGFLWWDFIHLSSWGQRLAGQYLADEILRLKVLENSVR